MDNRNGDYARSGLPEAKPGGISPKIYPADRIPHEYNRTSADQRLHLPDGPGRRQARLCYLPCASGPVQELAVLAGEPAKPGCVEYGRHAVPGHQPGAIT